MDGEDKRQGVREMGRRERVMMYNTGEPNCSQKREDCTSYRNGKCVILTDTEFKRDCPFYKERKRKDEDSTNN